MTQVAASTFQPAAARITSISRNPLGGGFQEVLRIKGSTLPANGDYQFIVFGRLGDVTINSDQPFLYADLMLGNGIGGFFTSVRHVVALQDQQIRRGADAEGRGFPFLLMHQAAGWTTGDDLVLYARIYDETTFPPTEISYSVAQVGILAFNLTAIGSSHYIAEEGVLGSTAINFKASGRQVLHTTSILPWTSGAEDWVFFWSSRVRAMEPTNRYGVYIEAWDGSTIWDWGDGFPDGPFGGAFLRGPLTPNAIDIAGYSLGSIVQQQVTTATTSLRLRAMCNYDVGTQAVYRQGRLFGLRLSKLHEWKAQRAVNESGWYGAFGAPAGRVEDEVFDIPHVDALWLSAAVPVPVDRVTGYHTRLKHNETKELNLPEKLFVAQGHAPLEGLYEIAGGKVDLHDQNNFFDHETVRLPSESQHLLHFVGLISGGSPPGVFQVGETIQGQTSGATVRNREVRTNPSPKNIAFFAGSRAGTFTPGEVVVGLGSGAQVTLRTTPNPLEEPAPNDGRFRQFVVLDLFDDPPAISIPDQVTGPDVVYIPGREGPSLASLQTIPWGVSEPVRFELVGDRVYLSPRAGYKISWPRFTTIRRRAVFPFRGLTLGQRDALITWATLQGIAAFKHTDLDDVERAYVIEIGPDERPRIDCTDRGVLHDVDIHALELRWLT